ncbi:hypothetical protein ACF1GW_39015 [Streptomyces achromogenes]|uniref:hypothetical protein n=1 Tax=Streptomyces achromogenes TaxID=67255 RepID=UPI0036F502A9
MTCEDTTAVRLTWEIQELEPYSKVWICRGYGRATTTAAPADIARAVLAGHLATRTEHGEETFRALAYTDTSGPQFVTEDQLAGAWTAAETVLQALPTHLRDALAAAATPRPGASPAL